MSFSFFLSGQSPRAGSCYFLRFQAPTVLSTPKAGPAPVTRRQVRPSPPPPQKFLRQPFRVPYFFATSSPSAWFLPASLPCRPPLSEQRVKTRPPQNASSSPGPRVSSFRFLPLAFPPPGLPSADSPVECRRALSPPPTSLSVTFEKTANGRWSFSIVGASRRLS